MKENTTHSSFFTSGSSPSILYRLPKIHKANVSMRHSLSHRECMSIDYNVSFLSSLLKKQIINKFTIQNIFTFYLFIFILLFSVNGCKILLVIQDLNSDYFLNNFQDFPLAYIYILAISTRVRCRREGHSD